MGEGLKGGCSFMEDYTYHLNPKGMKVLGAHMLEICPTIAGGKVNLEVHPLGIGGKADPARLVFNVPAGPAIITSLIDMGNRFRLIVHGVDCVKPDADLPKLPVARALWVPQPDLKVGAAAWIYAGGAHHTGFSQAVTAEHLDDFSEMANLECVFIDKETAIPRFQKGTPLEHRVLFSQRNRVMKQAAHPMRGPISDGFLMLSSRKTSRRLFRNPCRPRC